MQQWGMTHKCLIPQQNPTPTGSCCTLPSFIPQQRFSGRLWQAHTHVQMGLKPFGSRRDCSNREASPRNDPRLGKGNTWQGVSVPRRAGRVMAQLSAFLSLALAWLETHVAMLQEESEEGKRQVLQ